MSKIYSVDKKVEHIVVDISEESGSSFGIESALKPIIIWLKLSTGVDITRIKTTGKETTLFSILLFLYGVFVLFFDNACTFIFNYVYLKQRIHIHGSNATKPISTHDHINNLAVIFVHICEFIFVCGLHVCFFAQQNRFKGLWNTLLIIEREFKICPFTYRSIRRSLWIGFVIIPLNSVAFSLYFYLKTSSRSMIPAFYLSLMTLTELYPASIIILLWVLVRIVSNIFTVLKRRMKALLINENKMIELDDLRKWKVHHGLACDLIKKINFCFGMINLLIMIRTFITFIYNVYQFVGCLMDLSINPSFYIFKFFLQATLPCYLIYTCSQLKEQSAKIANILNSVDIYARGGYLEVQTLANALYLQVLQANENITAGRLFHLDFHLFPTLIGTTLTYVIILVSAG